MAILSRLELVRTLTPKGLASILITGVAVRNAGTSGEGRGVSRDAARNAGDFASQEGSEVCRLEMQFALMLKELE